MVYFGRSNVGFLFLIVSSLQGPDEMNRPHLITNTPSEVVLVALVNLLLSVCNLAMKYSLVKKQIKTQYAIHYIHIYANIYIADMCIKSKVNKTSVLANLTVG